MSQSSAVLVEGKRDRQALQRLGIKNIFTLEGKRLTDLPNLLEGEELGREIERLDAVNSINSKLELIIAIFKDGGGKFPPFLLNEAIIG